MINIRVSESMVADAKKEFKEKFGFSPPDVFVRLCADQAERLVSYMLSRKMKHPDELSRDKEGCVKFDYAKKIAVEQFDAIEKKRRTA